jgi:lysophospholipase L1-like esterase
VFLSIFILLVAAEITLRIIGDSVSVLIFRMAAEKAWDAERRFKLRKNFQSGDIKINSKGFFGPEFDAKKPSGSFRIVTIGDSASVMPASYNYPRALEDDLRKLVPDRRIDVINASCPGYDSGQSRVWYEQEVDGYEHDMLIVYIGWNDMGQYNPDGLAYKLDRVGYLKEPTLFEKMILHCYLLRSVYVVQGHWERRGNLSMAPLEGQDAKKYAEFYPGHFEKNLRAIVELAKSRGRKVWMLNYGGLVVESPTPDEETRIHFPRGMGKSLTKYLALKKSYEAALSKVAKETSTPIIDVEAYFADPEKRRVFTDPHFTEEGSKCSAPLYPLRSLATFARNPKRTLFVPANNHLSFNELSPHTSSQTRAGMTRRKKSN